MVANVTGVLRMASVDDFPRDSLLLLASSSHWVSRSEAKNVPTKRLKTFFVLLAAAIWPTRMKCDSGKCAPNGVAEKVMGLHWTECGWLFQPVVLLVANVMVVFVANVNQY